MYLSQISGTGLPLFVGLFSVLFVGWRIWKKPVKQIGSAWWRYAKNWTSQKTQKIRGGANWFPVWFVLFCCTCLVWAGHRLEAAPVVEKFNVQVLKQVGINKWAMSDDQGPFLYTACDDFPNAKVIWAGYIARKVRWQEFGSCKSIRRQDLGFWWQRGENYDVKEIPR